MKVIAGGRGAVNPYAAIAKPYLEEFHKKMIERRGGTRVEVAFNKFSPPERKAIFVLGNASADIWPGKMARLGQEQIDFNYTQFSAQEKLTLISGMRALKKLADKLPLSQPGEEAADRIMRKALENEVPTAEVTRETILPDRNGTSGS
ncbi:hypothetical protein [Pantoea ananatis]|uniref:hypothetical protein n=1 Tax=Pantoea ananas TaxID=553 RepID=UPI001B30BEDE|nr:hypothetical protein [Pantoea ananatis]